jgi:hypothetical protein
MKREINALVLQANATNISDLKAKTRFVLDVNEEGKIRAKVHDTDNCQPIEKCTRRKCGVCDIWKMERNAIDLTAKPSYVSRNISCHITTPSDCNTKNVVYLLSCPEDSCHFKYVGETKRQLRTRINEHLNGIRQNLQASELQRHMSSAHGHTVMPHLQLLETLEDSSDKTRKEAELNWIKALCTIYPFGGNNQLLGYTNIDRETDITTRKPIP